MMFGSQPGESILRPRLWAQSDILSAIIGAADPCIPNTPTQTELVHRAMLRSPMGGAIDRTKRLVGS